MTLHTMCVRIVAAVFLVWLASIACAATSVVPERGSRTVCSQEGWFDMEFEAYRPPPRRGVSKDLDVALTTHGTVDRVGAVARACDEWDGPLHFALYLSPALDRTRWEHVSPRVGIEQFWRGSPPRDFVPLDEQLDAAVAAISASPCLRTRATVHVVRPGLDEWAAVADSDAARRAALHAAYGLHNPFVHYPMNTMRNAAAEGARRAGHVLHMVVDADLAIVTGGRGCRGVSEQAWAAFARAARPSTAVDPGTAPFPRLAWAKALIVLPAVEVPTARRQRKKRRDRTRCAPVRRSLWTAAGIVAAIGAECASHYYNALVYPYDLRNITVPSAASAFFDRGVKRDPIFHMRRHTTDWGRSMENYFIAPLVNGGPTPFDERFIGRHLDKISWYHDQRARSPGIRLLRIADVARGPFLVNEGCGGSLTGDALDSDTNTLRSTIHDGLLLAKASPVATIFPPRFLFADARSPTLSERVSVALAAMWRGPRRAAVLALATPSGSDIQHQPWCLGAEEFEGAAANPSGRRLPGLA